MKKLKLERLADSGDELCNLVISGAYYRICMPSVSVFFFNFYPFYISVFCRSHTKNSVWRISNGTRIMV